MQVFIKREFPTKNPNVPSERPKTDLDVLRDCLRRLGIRYDSQTDLLNVFDEENGVRDIECITVALYSVGYESPECFFCFRTDGSYIDVVSG